MTRVPNTNDYSLVHVRDAVKSHTPTVQDNLDSCFTNAISSYFDPNYNNNTYAGETTGKSLKRFRNYGKTYEIETLRILDSPSQYGNEVSWQNLQHSTNYYLEVRLNNPDSTFVKNIYWRLNWTDTHTTGRYDYTWLYFYNVVFGDKYIVFDHDIPEGPGLIKYRVNDKPASFDVPGEYYEIGVASNYGSIFYLTFKAKPYANFHSSIKKTINLFNTEKPNGDTVSFINPNRTFLFPYVQDNSFKFYYPTVIDAQSYIGGKIYLYGFPYLTYRIWLVNSTGQLIFESELIYGGVNSYFIYSVYKIPGYYYIKIVDADGNLLEDVGTLLLV